MGDIEMIKLTQTYFGYMKKHPAGLLLPLGNILIRLSTEGLLLSTFTLGFVIVPLADYVFGFDSLRHKRRR